MRRSHRKAARIVGTVVVQIIRHPRKDLIMQVVLPCAGVTNWDRIRIRAIRKRNSAAADRELAARNVIAASLVTGDCQKFPLDTTAAFVSDPLFPAQYSF